MINSWPSSYLTHEQYWQSLSLSPFEMLDSRNPYSPGFPHLFFFFFWKQNKTKQKQKPTACFQCSLLVLPHFLNLMDFPGHRTCSSVFCTIYTHSFNILIQFHGLYNIYMLMTPMSSSSSSDLTSILKIHISFCLYTYMSFLGCLIGISNLLCPKSISSLPS